MKEIKSNYHIHTTWCDGKSSTREMIESALKAGYTSIGILCHSMYPFSSDWHIPVNSHKAFFDEVLSVRNEYSDKIKVYAGLESDFIRGMCSPDLTHYRENNADFSPEYMIGSVHFIQGDHGLFGVDGSYEEFQRGVKRHFKGNAKKAVQEYFYLQRMMLEKCSFTILGHPDLIRKLNGKLHFFDENDGWYKREIKSLIRVIASRGICVEVNTGAMSRGFTTLPYPSPWFLEELHGAGIPVTFSSDAHSAETVDWWYNEALEYIRKAGYRELVYLNDGKYDFYKI